MPSGRDGSARRERRTRDDRKRKISTCRQSIVQFALPTDRLVIRKHWLVNSYHVILMWEKMYTTNNKHGAWCTVSFRQSYQACAWFLPVENLKKEKKRCIVALVERRDVLAWLPTGFGKSLIYQFYSKIFELVKCKTGHAICSLAITIEQVQELKEMSCALQPPCWRITVSLS